MARWTRLATATGTALWLAAALGGCSTLRTAANLESGAGTEAVRMWDRWVDSGGDIATATTWERRAAPGVTVEQIEQAFASVAAEYNLRAVGELPLSKELEARTGQPQKFLKVYGYCNPSTARRMLDFSPAMAAYLPCRITVMERNDGLWLYTLNMDMMTRMGRRMPAELRAETGRVRDAIRAMLDRGAAGEF
ncbi:DUF302 domain-containing protein [Sphaerotilus sp.]|jgi:uncharacterized protein (DUF302 family)|uniref:DUF302 domain-containing protein n=1 Tax=Sphaerotilus sp. TaxID=2093942 RepID=UPI0025F8A234|nr:DUF302 domain-containing protein [Sphaerotilus sp.]